MGKARQDTFALWHNCFYKLCPFILLSATDKVSLGERPVSLEILNGGKYYFIADAYERVAKKTCQVASLRAKRRLDPADQQWKVEV